MNWPFWVGLLLIAGSLFAAYRFGLVSGYAEGHSDGYADGKREGAKEGSRRGYAVGFDRGRRRATDTQEEEVESSVGGGPSRWWLAGMGVLLASCAFYSLAGRPQAADPSSLDLKVYQVPPGQGPFIGDALPTASHRIESSEPHIE